MTSDSFDERRRQAIETLDDDSVRSFFLAYVADAEEGVDDEIDLEWEKAHDVTGEQAQNRNGWLAGALILAMAEEGDHSIDEVAVAAKRNAEIIADSAGDVEVTQPDGKE
jgi:hypothetical protein